MLAVTQEQVRALRLARQHLLERAPRDRIAEVVADVGGIQAQVMSAAELAVWARCEDVTPEDVREALWDRRDLVKTWCMRGTLHLLPAFEFPLWAAALRNRAGWRKPVWLRAFDVTVEEMEALIEAVEAALAGRALTRDELAEEVAAAMGEHIRTKLLQGWGTYLKPAAYEGVLCFGPNRGRNVTFVRPVDWLGARSDRDGDEAMRELCRRFLRTYGPATHEDFARWWGTDPAPARRILRSIDDDVAQVEAEGRAAWVLADDLELLRSLEPPRAVHLLPNFDLYVLHYRPREAFVPDGLLDRVYRTAGWVSPVVLVDGAVAGIWELKRRARSAEVRFEPLVRLTNNQRKGIAREVDRLAAFLGAPVHLVEG